MGFSFMNIYLCQREKMKNLRFHIILFLLFTLGQSLQGQIRVSSDVYTVKNGLSQSSVLDMAKDHAGFVWFATKDGLCRFDGYSFVNYKATTKQFHCSINNQFVQLVVDKYGFLWVRNSMGQAFCFNPHIHTFELFPNMAQNRGENFVSVRQIMANTNGDVWLLGDNNGVVRVRHKGQNLEQTIFCTSRSPQIGNIVNYEFRTSNGLTCLLTNRGFAVIKDNDNKTEHVFYAKENMSCYDAVESTRDLLIACSTGRLIKYDKRNRKFSIIKINTNSDLNGIFLIKGSKILLTTKNDGIFFLDLNTGIQQHPYKNTTPIFKSWQDKRGDVWIKNLGKIGFTRYASSIDKFSSVPIQLQEDIDIVNQPKYNFSFAYKDNNERLWCVPIDGKSAWYDDGVSRANFSKGETPIFYRMLSDVGGVYWTSTSLNGIQKNVRLNSSLQFLQCHPCSSCPEINDVSAAYEDLHQRLWIATRDHCVRLYTNTHRLIGYVAANGKTSLIPSIFDMPISVIYQDKQGNMWLGGANKLMNFMPQTTDAHSFSVKSFSLASNAPANTEITDILEDSKGRIWLTTDGDGLQLLEKKGTSYYFANRHNDFRNSYPPTVLKTNCLYEDSSGNLWMGSSEGITVFPVDFSMTRFLKFFFYNPENTDMETSYISDIYQDRDGFMWFASFGGGIFNIPRKFQLGETPTIRTYSSENNRLSTDLVLSMHEDSFGYLWIITENAILKFNRYTGESESFGAVSGLNHFGFSKRAFIRTKDGNFVVGTNSGFYILAPNKLKKSNYIPQVVFTRFQLFNKDIDFSSSDSPINTDIEDVKELNLNHNQSVFSIEYSALDFRNSNHIQYAYRLDGFEKEWNYVGNKRVASYTNLPPGTYTFRVKSTNSEGNWCQNDRLLIIHVHPSFWQTGWAWLLYLLLFAGIVCGILYAYLAFYKMRAKMQMENDMSAMKLQFFTDVSHELRTPLTLITAPVENLLLNGNLNGNDRQQLEVVHNNADRMLRMLTQILDFRKLQSNKMRLRVEKTNIASLVERCCSNFEKIAERRHIIFKHIDLSNGACFWVDRDKMDTIMFNLLSNAFKFTPEWKSINVEVCIDNGDCLITVSDEGCGIASDKLSSIFERFITLKDKSLTNQSGTGIGLSLVKEIADLHHAEVNVVSQENVGSSFSIRLKAGTEHYGTSADIIVDDEELPDNTGIQPMSESSEMELGNSDDNKTKLLIIEDNDDLRSFIIKVLSKNFIMIGASNGEIGWQKTLQELPDFVITDIMMPIMDGISYVKKLRADERTSHIPVVLLTAKTDIQSKIDCMRIGANDYITKPFSMVYLETRIQNILDDRRKWQEQYRRQLTESENKNQGQDISDSVSPQSESISEDLSVHPENELPNYKDDIFMKRFIAYIDDNMSNSSLTLENIADGLKISRWTLSSKIKSLVGQPPVEFIRDLRLNRAIQLINEGELNMTQITYTIGMTDSRYFSRCFKQKFGVTPTEYKNKGIG